jgi:vancomycin resistance protein YoaR
MEVMGMHKFLLTTIATVSLVTFPADARILQNTFINEVNVGSLTYDAALSLLEDKISVADEQIVIICADTEHIYTFRDFHANYSIAAALEEAMKYSHDGGFFSKLRRKLSANFKAHYHHINAEFAYNADTVAQIAKKIRDDAAISVAEPTYAIEHDRFVISDGRIGLEIDTETLTAGIIDILETREGGKIAAAVTKIYPKYDTADFEAARNLIGSFHTPYNPHMPERTANLTVASTFLDGQVILPGETFSTSAALRPRTAENGYVKAGQILNGEPDAGIGGGICQISGTLYMAALYAEINVRERANHSLMVGYMKPATDAALAEGYIDLVLENNTKHPILIQSTLACGYHVINIYGHESRPAGRTIAFESVLLETRHPDGDKIIEDPFLPMGTMEIVSEGIAGAKYELYKIITENGATHRIKVNTSSYRPLQRVVRVGAANAEPQ